MKSYVLKYCLKAFAFLLLLSMNEPVISKTVEIRSVVLTPAKQADVPAQTTGTLINFAVNWGETVKQGQVLAQIDDSDAVLKEKKAEYELQIAEKLATDNLGIDLATKKLDFSKAEYQRLVIAQQAQPRSVSSSEIERAKLELDQSEIELIRSQREQELARLRLSVARGALDEAKREVQLRKILSPINGKIESLTRHLGEWVKPGDSMFHIVSTSKVRAEGFATLSSLGISMKKLKNLTNAQVELFIDIENAESKPHKGKIIFVSSLVDPVNGQLRVGAEFDNLLGELTPGLRGRMMLQLPESTTREKAKEIQ